MPVLTRDDSPEKVAAAVLDFFDANPEVHNQSLWFSADDDDAVFPADEPPPCGTTVCAAGAVAHLLGYTLMYEAPYRSRLDLVTDNSGGPIMPSASQHVAGPALGLTATPAARLFHRSTNEQAMTALRAIADGADPSKAVYAAIPDDSSYGGTW